MRQPDDWTETEAALAQLSDRLAEAEKLLAEVNSDYERHVLQHGVPTDHVKRPVNGFIPFNKVWVEVPTLKRIHKFLDGEYSNE